MRALFVFASCLLIDVVCSAGSEGGLRTLEVTEVSENSATLHWDSSAYRLAKGQLKLVCTGSSVYTLQSGAQHVSYSTSAQAAPRDINTLSLSDLHPNTNYTCVVIYEDHDVREVYSISTHFCTYYSEPSPPPAPVVLPVPKKQKQSQSLHPLLLQLDLLPASAKYGPIHGYELQFFVVLPHEAKSGKIKHPIQHQLRVPFGTQNSLQDATSATEAVNFAYHVYESGSLPTRVNISTRLVGRALKRNTTYSAVLLAYTNDTAHKRILLSYSPFSKFFFIPDYHVPGVFSHFKQEYREALTSIVFGSALPVLAVVGFVLLTVALGWRIRKKRSRTYRRKQLLRPVFKRFFIQKPDEQREEDCQNLLDEATGSEEQLSPLTSAPSQSTHPNTQTSETAAVCSQVMTEVPHTEDRLSSDAYNRGPAGRLRKGSVVAADIGHGTEYTSHTANRRASTCPNKFRRMSTSVRYTKLVSDSSDSEDEGASRPPPRKMSITRILAREAIKSSSPAFRKTFPPFRALNYAARTPAEGVGADPTEPQAGVDIELGKEYTDEELEDCLLREAFLDHMTASMAEMHPECEPIEYHALNLLFGKKFDLLPQDQTKHMPFHPYCLFNPTGPEQQCPVKGKEGEDVTGCDHVYELARMYNRQYGGTDSVSNGAERTVDRACCEPQVEGICSGEWDIGDIVSPNALSPRLSTASDVEECPQFSPSSRKTCSVPGPLESDSSLTFPQELSLSSIPCIVRDSDPSLLHLPSRSESGEVEGIISADSFAFKQPLMHSSGIAHPRNDPSSPSVTLRPPSAASPRTPRRRGSMCPGLPQPQEDGLLLLLQSEDTSTPNANASSTASFDLLPVPSEVDICSKITLVGTSSSSDQTEQP